MDLPYTELSIADIGLRFLATDQDQSSPALTTDLLSPAEQARCQQITHEATRRGFLTARQLLRHTLSDLGPRPPQHWRFAIGPQGRPHLANPLPAMADLDFNLAHSRALVVVAWRPIGRLGVDLEPVDRQLDHDLVARRFFHDRERQALSRLDGPARRRRFLSLWVLKEALLKADGRGLSAGLDQVVIAFDAPDNPRIIALPDDAPQGWQIWLRQTRGHLLGLATTPRP